MLKLYTYRKLLTEANRKKVFPLLFDLCYVENKSLQAYYQVVDAVEPCDIIVVPIDFVSFCKYPKALSGLKAEAQKYRKPIWLYTAGDFGFTVNIPNSYNFRLGGFHSKLSVRTVMLPSFVNDPFVGVLKQGFSVVSKKERPHIGFVGHAQGGLFKYLKAYLNHLKQRLKLIFKMASFDKQPFYPSGVKRAQYLNQLKSSTRLHTHFVYRKAYRAGAKNQQEIQKTTAEFYNNIFDNLYTFCVRGAGNFSVRFYETLAVGRIPILLDTDCRLPLSELIDWNKHVLVLHPKSPESLEQQIFRFHASKSASELEAIQKSNRLLWETHLRRDSYFIKIHDIFTNKLKPTHV